MLKRPEIQLIASMKYALGAKRPKSSKYSIYFMFETYSLPVQIGFFFEGKYSAFEHHIFLVE